MGAISITSESIQEQKRKALQQFETQLTELSLGKEQIEKQTLPELEASLERVNDALNHPESFVKGDVHKNIRNFIQHSSSF